MPIEDIANNSQLDEGVVTMPDRKIYVEVAIDGCPGASPSKLEEQFLETMNQCDTLDENFLISCKSAKVETDEDDDEQSGIVGGRITFSTSALPDEPLPADEEEIKEVVEKFFGSVKDYVEKEYEGAEFKIEAISVE
jgi:hypothetical protein